MEKLTARQGLRPAAATRKSPTCENSPTTEESPEGIPLGEELILSCFKSTHQRINKSTTPIQTRSNFTGGVLFAFHWQTYTFLSSSTQTS